MSRRRSAGADEAEEGYLGSVSDLMSALMFIFIITLAVFVLMFAIKAQGADDARSHLLATIKDELKKENVTSIEVITDHGIVRFGEAILFESGKADVSSEGVRVIEILRRVLERVLPCYVADAPASGCSPESKLGKVDAVFVEGHTDLTPYGSTTSGRFRDNWELSAARAREVYLSLVPSSSAAAAFRNENRETLFSVAGYAETRPVDSARLEPNRRIDLRFVMTLPIDARQPSPVDQVQREFPVR